ncbi:MAG: hypothetical protein FJ109_21960, partial [Deltaproteobacteria bacterium]|nr:hypothetical protein [Deltaproteobacteria bacterium]
MGRPGTFGYLRFHRKHSHAALLAPFLAVGIATGLQGVGSTTSLPLLITVAFLALAWHLGLDILNAFGTPLGLPFSRKRLHADLIYEFDPFVTSVLAGTVGVQVAVRSGLADCSSLGVGLVGLLVLLGYVGTRAWSRKRFCHEVRKYVVAMQEVALAQSVVPSSYWRWKGIVATSSAHHVLRESMGRG